VTDVCKIIDRLDILPFKMIVKDTNVRFKSFCNYWICNPEIFDDYVESYLSKLITWFEECDDAELVAELNKSIKYRDKDYTVHSFVLELLFERYVEYKKHSWEYIIFKQ
jgi:hypothetical protein